MPDGTFDGVELAWIIAALLLAFLAAYAFRQHHHQRERQTVAANQEPEDRPFVGYVDEEWDRVWPARREP